MTLKARAVLGTTVAGAALLVPMRAAVQAATPLNPDVVVLSYPLGKDQATVGISYSGLVAHAAVQRDLQLLQSSGLGTFHNVRITDDYAEVEPRPHAQRVRMTSAEFVADRSFSAGNGTFDLEPVVRGFHQYNCIAVTYFARPGFRFHGLRDYHDAAITVHFDQHGSAYTYRVWIRNGALSHWKLPKSSPPVDPQRVLHGTLRGAAPGVALLCLGVVALVASMKKFIPQLS